MIDVKELRVGAHINVDGKRVTVDEITNTSLVAYITNDNDWAACSPDEDWINPISLTAALLAELGFDLYDDEREGGVLDTGDYFIWVEEREGHYWQCQIRERFGLKDDIVDYCGFTALHQLETIVYNATEIELIKED